MAGRARAECCSRTNAGLSGCRPPDAGSQCREAAEIRWVADAMINGVDKENYKNCFPKRTVCFIVLFASSEHLQARDASGENKRICQLLHFVF